MLLRIIDKINEEQKKNNEHTVQVILEINGKIEESYVINDFPSLLSHNFRESLAWYFAKYPLIACQKNNITDKNVGNKIITLGQNMGDILLGEDHELIKIKDIIEDYGYENLQVQIESDTSCFHAKYWETLILPESKYVLSSATRSFTHQFQGKDGCGNQDKPDIHYELSCDTPLNILHLVSRSSDNVDESLSQGLNRQVDILRFDSAFNYQFLVASDFSNLENHLNKLEKPVHIFHYDGPIEIRNGVAYFLLGYKISILELVPAVDFLRLLAAKGIALLCIESQYYVNEEEDIATDKNLSCIAKTAIEQGVNNVIGLANLINPRIASECFKALYTGISTGISLDQAIIEARKSLQKKTETEIFISNPKPFQIWPLLIQYSCQSVYFFSDIVNSIELYDTENYKKSRQKLYGFQSEWLPPQILNCMNATLVNLAQDIQFGTLCYLLGASGSGKTHLTHQFAFHLSLTHQIESAFYFDFKTGFYSKSDIIEMIEPLLKKEKEENLFVNTNLFVFDNFDQLGKDEADFSDLIEWIEFLRCNNQIILLTGVEEKHTINNAINYPIRTLDMSEQQLLSADILRAFNIEDFEKGEDFNKLLTLLRMSPFLTKKVLPCLESMGVNKLCAEVNKQVVTGSNVVYSYYQWQFELLPLFWKRFLLILLDAPNLLLEIIAIPCNKDDGYPPARELFNLLEGPDVSFFEGLEKLKKSGFLKALSQGSVLTPDSHDFLQAKLSGDSFVRDNQEKIHLLLSKIIIEGLNRTILYIQKQPNPILKNYLLNSRRHFVKHLERLWFSQDYLDFTRARHNLTSLMKQEKLDYEMAEWSKELINKTDLSVLWVTNKGGVSEESEASIIASLLLAKEALGHQDAEKEQALVYIATNASEYLNSLNFEESEDDITLFRTAVGLLELFYRKCANWELLKNVNEIAVQLYEAKEFWSLLIPSLRSWSQCCFLLEDREQGLELERKILEDLPYNKLPPHIKAQMLKETILARDVRGEAAIIQPLLDNYKILPEAEGDQLFIDNIQAEIYLRQEEYENAVRCFFQLLDNSRESGQPNLVVQHLKNKLDYIKKKMGENAYSSMYEKLEAVKLKK